MLIIIFEKGIILFKLDDELVILGVPGPEFGTKLGPATPKTRSSEFRRSWESWEVGWMLPTGGKP